MASRRGRVSASHYSKWVERTQHKVLLRSSLSYQAADACERDSQLPSHKAHDKRQPRQLTTIDQLRFFINVSGTFDMDMLGRLDIVQNWKKIRERTLYYYRCFAEPCRIELLNIAVRAYDIYLIIFKNDLCPISSLCLISVPAAIKPRMNSQLASGNMGAPCSRTKNISTSTCHMNISNTVVCGILALPHNAFENGCGTNKDLHQNFLSP